MKQLKLCPFCNGNPVISMRSEGNEKSGYCVFHSVYCVDCGSRTDDLIFHDEAVENWNTRADGWISVKEYLPINQCETFMTIDVVAYIEGDEYPFFSIFKCGHNPKFWSEFTDDGAIAIGVTHWMPLPQPPKVTK